MTSEKQVKANQANAKKSTGAKTPEGKAVVAGNAIKHGLFSSRLILPSENIEEFHQLLDDLIDSLRPHGSFELLLVEKIAVAAWRQLRLTRAESASIELSTRTEMKEVRKGIEKALAIGWQEGEISAEDFKTLSDDDLEQLQWCRDIVAEYDALNDEVLDSYLLETLKQEAPNIYGQLVYDYEKHMANLVPRMQMDGTSLHEWAHDLYGYCTKVISKAGRKPMVQTIARTVQASLATPMANELMVRYQVALDGELYRAAEALRRQQEHRQKIGIVVEAA